MRLLSSLLLLTLTLPALAASVVLDKAISGFASPESVVVAGPAVYVSNLGEKLEPFARDGDGFISRLDRAGNVKKLKWVDKLDAPKGLLVVNGVVYVTDIDRVLGFRQADAKKVFELDFSATGAKFLNALARSDDRHLLVSSTDLNRVFVIDLAGKSYAELKFDTPPKGPNGLKKLGSRLIVAEWGSGEQADGGVKTYRLDGMTAKLDQAYTPDPAGYFDGVVSLTANRWLVSNWVKFEPAGLLQVIDTQTGGISVANPKLLIAGPADLFLDDTHVLWVPGMLEGKVYRLRLRY